MVDAVGGKNTALSQQTQQVARRVDIAANRAIAQTVLNQSTSDVNPSSKLANAAPVATPPTNPAGFANLPRGSIIDITA